MTDNGDTPPAWFEPLNDAFYTADIGRYFRARIDAVLAEAGTTASWDSALAAEVTARLPGWEVEQNEDTVADRQAALTVDAFVLAHHAGEVLLRHVMAQIDSPPPNGCAWLAMTILQRGRDFKARLQEQILDASADQLVAVVRHVFLPNRDALVGVAGKDEVDVAERFAAEWLRHFADYYLKTSNGYNATKHGLGAIAGSYTVAFYVDPDANPTEVIEAAGGAGVPIIDGPTLESLEYEMVDKRANWKRVVRGVDHAGLVVTAIVAASMLDWAQEVARARYFDRPAEIVLPTGPLPADVLRDHEREWNQVERPIGAQGLPEDEARAVMRRLGIPTDPP
jgi:hypothetical protein